MGESKLKLKNAKTNKEYTVYNLGLKEFSDCCCGCWNQYRGCKRKHFACHPEKGRIRNWKEFRKTQWKSE